MVWDISWWEKTNKTSEHGNIYINLITHEERTFADLPIGACFARDFPPYGYDGKAISCKMPFGKIWHIDSPATNCSLPDDGTHRCWVRHGTIGDKLTVDKNGETCSAGKGSIVIRNHAGKIIFHSMLTNGILQ